MLDKSGWSLEKYVGKHIQVTFNDNQILKGYVNGHTSIYDSDDGVEELTIKTDKYPYVGFNKNEIKSIQIIE
ncbi:hypothetical protein SAMN04487786_1104 [Paenisporosarcina quisquiliarum]|nr:hypothetical protein SAMN04487786_1104 [Paenisporosarcina quisquiliarum]